MVEPLRGGSERLLTFRLNSTEGPITLVSVYALTLSATSDAKDEFYEKLASIIRSIASTEQLIILGDFNARVGADCDSWPSCLGSFGVGKLNENGQRLLELCTFLNLCITNSFFKTKPQHKVSWSHPRSKHWHQQDLIMVRHAAIKNVLRTCSYHSADCDTDHSLVCCKIRLQPKNFHCAKKLGTPRIDVSKMTHPGLVKQLAVAFEKEHDAKSSIMSPVIEAKRTALAEYTGHPLRGTCRCSGLPGIRFSTPPGAVRTSTGQNSVRQFRRMLQRATSEGRTKASRRYWE